MSYRQQDESQAIFETLPAIEVERDWTSLFSGDNKSALEHQLPDFLRHRRWFGGKGRRIKMVSIAESIAVPHDETASYLTLIQVQYTEGSDDTYLLGVSYAPLDEAHAILRHDRNAAVVRVHSGGGDGIVYDAVRDRGFVIALLDSIDRESRFESSDGKVAAVQTEKFHELRSSAPDVEPRVMGAEQSNTSIVFGERLILKLFRRVENGLNPDFEVGRFLTEHGFFNTPPVAGAIEISSTENDDEPKTLGILQGFVPNQGDAWKYTLDSLHHAITRASEHPEEALAIATPELGLIELANEQPPQALYRFTGDYLEAVKLLGRRTAEMHLTLDSTDSQPNFAPEHFSAEYQRSIYTSMLRMARSIAALLRNHLDQLRGDDQKRAHELLDREDELYSVYGIVLDTVFDAERIRIHGDYHLGQVLYTGSDFVIIDFEGEPLRPIRERRIKRSPLRDVAGMLRSFDYAGHTGLANANVSGDERRVAQRFSDAWVMWVSAAFLGEYLKICAGARFLPRDPQQTAIMLDLFLLDKAVYELGYEINNRPTWVSIPISGILRILDQRARRAETKRRRVA